RVGALDVGGRSRRTDVAAAGRDTRNRALAPLRAWLRGIVDAARRRTGLPCRLRGAAAASGRDLSHLGAIGQYERRGPERVPAVLRDDLRRELDAGAHERLRLLHAHAPDAADDVILRRQMLADALPLTAFANREIGNRRRAAFDREAGARLLPRFSGP